MYPHAFLGGGVLPGFFWWPEHRLGHPKNYLGPLSTKFFSGSEYPKNVSFDFENRRSGCHHVTPLIDGVVVL